VDDAASSKERQPLSVRADEEAPAVTATSELEGEGEKKAEI
jgi:hypothetical protein